MDFRRKTDLEQAREALKRAERARMLPQLCEALDQALACFQEWSPAQFDEMTRLHQQLVEQRHTSRLRAAAATAEVRLEDLVEILRSAIEDGFTSRGGEFEAVEVKLTALISGLTREANADELAEERAEAYVRALGPLPEALFWDSVAVADLRRRLAERRQLEGRRDTLERSLQDLVTRAEGASGHDEVAGFGLQVQARLREATLGDSASPEILEQALQDVALKRQSGALHRAALSAPLVDSARKQLQTLLQQELEEHLERAGKPGGIQSGAAGESVEEAPAKLSVSCGAWRTRVSPPARKSAAGPRSASSRIETAA
eukprot:s1189_g11.t1